ncbi:hypothetical protein [Acinetobacter equi]|uniref:Uncharacterized protein n=1 Tax=Acinetobacter equi TaxID=1324350 RepID=A0A0N9VMR5_9GAMM|nr:hypothetical protein [Acinetobacter equi]ALH94681.1 hypothetical protein AOY20_03560 [Acinetobacter equi]
MLKVPEYLLLTVPDVSFEKPEYNIKIKVVFVSCGVKNPMSDRYIDQLSLSFLLSAFKDRKLHFMSFDEHPFRIKKMSYLTTGLKITVEPILESDPDYFGISWEPSGLVCRSSGELELIPFRSKIDDDY